MTDIAIVGDHWRDADERARAAFVGADGYELTKMLDEAGIRRADCFLTTVLQVKPPRNDIETLCLGKTEGIPGMPPIKSGKYLPSKYASELARLYKELSNVKPNVCIALGNPAIWALMHNTGISKSRGIIAESNVIRGLKILPTYHPTMVHADWSLRPVTVIDLAKARRESAFPEIRRPKTWVYWAETLADLEVFYEELSRASYISFDIETFGDQITCIGFASSEEKAMVIPFVDNRVVEPQESRGSFWRTAQDEARAWEYVRRILALPMPKFGQNTLYDIHFLWRAYGITVNNFADDTMLLHHALQPESLKGLGFLGSVYTDRSAWKTMRTKVLTINKDK